MVELSALRQCGRCKQHYQELENLGSWQCRYHPRSVIFSPCIGPRGVQQAYTHPCCGISPYASHAAYAGEDMARGCQQCDHVMRGAHEQDLTFTLEMASAILRDRLEHLPGAEFDSRTNDVHITRRPVA